MSMCKPSCVPTVNVEVCKGYGNQAGKDSAQFACDLSRVSIEQCAPAQDRHTNQ